jgi:hypothetical protein
MKTEKIIRTTALFSLLGAIGLLVWWFSMPVFLPVSLSATHFQELILDQDWTLVNLVGLIATVLLTLGFPGFYLSKQEDFRQPGFLGLVLASTGLILFVSIQYYETLLWPAAARVNPDLLQVQGALVSGDRGVLAGLLVSGIFLGVGYILFGIAALRIKAFPKLPTWFLLVGAPVFGNGIVFPVRTLGLILFCTGILWWAIWLRKNIKSH